MFLSAGSVLCDLCCLEFMCDFCCWDVRVAFDAWSFVCDCCCWELGVWFSLFRVLLCDFVAGSLVCDVSGFLEVLCFFLLEVFCFICVAWSSYVICVAGMFVWFSLGGASPGL